MAKNMTLVSVGASAHILCPTAKLSALLALLEQCELVDCESVPQLTRYEAPYVTADYMDVLVKRPAEIEIKANVNRPVVEASWVTKMRAEFSEKDRAICAENPYRVRALDRKYWGSQRFPNEEAARTYGDNNYGDKGYGDTGYEVGRTMDSGDVVLV